LFWHRDYFNILLYVSRNLISTRNTGVDNCLRSC
jgi:hypothetical protein